MQGEAVFARAGLKSLICMSGPRGNSQARNLCGASATCTNTKPFYARGRKLASMKSDGFLAQKAIETLQSGVLMRVLLDKFCAVAVRSFRMFIKKASTSVKIPLIALWQGCLLSARDRLRVCDHFGGRRFPVSSSCVFSVRD